MDIHKLTEEIVHSESFRERLQEELILGIIEKQKDYNDELKPILLTALKEAYKQIADEYMEEYKGVDSIKREIERQLQQMTKEQIIKLLSGTILPF